MPSVRTSTTLGGSSSHNEQEADSEDEEVFTTPKSFSPHPTVLRGNMKDPTAKIAKNTSKHPTAHIISYDRRKKKKKIKKNKKKEKLKLLKKLKVKKISASHFSPKEEASLTENIGAGDALEEAYTTGKPTVYESMINYRPANDPSLKPKRKKKKTHVKPHDEKKKIEHHIEIAPLRNISVELGRTKGKKKNGYLKKMKKKIGTKTRQLHQTNYIKKRSAIKKTEKKHKGAAAQVEPINTHKSKKLEEQELAQKRTEAPRINKQRKVGEMWVYPPPESLNEDGVYYKENNPDKLDRDGTDTEASLHGADVDENSKETILNNSTQPDTRAWPVKTLKKLEQKMDSFDETPFGRKSWVSRVIPYEIQHNGTFRFPIGIALHLFIVA